MSYTTALYAVDLDRLCAAVGSGDESIVDLVKQKIRDEDEDGRVRGRTLHVEVDENETILVEGKPASIDDFVRAMQELIHPGDRLLVYTGRSETGTKLKQAMYETADGIIESAGLCPSLEICGRREDVWDLDDEDDEESSEIESVLRGLVQGRFDEHEVHEYAYALKHLCTLYGEWLDADDSLGDLKPLKLDTKLCKPRLPVAIPEPDNFPVISYLTVVEVREEVSRFEKMNLSYPKDSDIEHAREMLVECLKQARERQYGVVAFYH